MRNKKLLTRQLQTRIKLNYRPLSRLSMDLKVIPRSGKGHKFILCIIDEATNYLIYGAYLSATNGSGRRSSNRRHHN